MYIYIIKQTEKHKAMKSQELKSFLTSNREVVISKYNSLKVEKFFNGISLADFMTDIMIEMGSVNIVEEKQLPILMTVIGRIYVKNSSVFCNSEADEKRREKYRGTAYMAMV